MPDLHGHSITCRIALGPQRGKKVFSLKTLSPPSSWNSHIRLAKAAGFSLHAGVSARADQRDTLEPLCRYISRPAVSEKRLSLTSNGQVRYQLKTPYRDGTTHVIFDPLDFLARLAALALRGPTPASGEPDGGAQLRFHGVFAWGGHPSNSAWRSRVTPAGPRPPAAGFFRVIPHSWEALPSARQAGAGKVWAARFS